MGVGLFGKHEIVHDRCDSRSTAAVSVDPASLHPASCIIASPMIDITILELIGVVAFLSHVAGVFAAVHAVMTARTSQGAIAWALFLHSCFPTSRCPRTGLWPRQISGVRESAAGRRLADRPPRPRAGKEDAACSACATRSSTPSTAALEELAEMPFTSHNDATLLDQRQRGVRRDVRRHGGGQGLHHRPVLHHSRRQPRAAN